MPQLVLPSMAMAARLSFLDAVAEFQADGWPAYQSFDVAGMQDPGTFTRYLAWLAADRDPETAALQGRVPATVLWYLDGGTYLGRVTIRHRLTPELAAGDGHIGYDIRPSARRQGHATAMLRSALAVAAGLRINPALVTCHQENAASARVIEACGGVLKDVPGGVRRYWVRTLGRTP